MHEETYKKDPILRTKQAIHFNFNFNRVRPAPANSTQKPPTQSTTRLPTPSEKYQNILTTSYHTKPSIRRVQLESYFMQTRSTRLPGDEFAQLSTNPGESTTGLDLHAHRGDTEMAEEVRTQLIICYDSHVTDFSSLRQQEQSSEVSGRGDRLTRRERREH